VLGFVIPFTWHNKLWKYAWPKPFCCTKPTYFQFNSSNFHLPSCILNIDGIVSTNFTELLWHVIHNYHMFTPLFWWLILICSTSSHSHICSLCLAQNCTLVPYIATLMKSYYYLNLKMREICISFGDNPRKVSITLKLLKHTRMEFICLNDQLVFLLSNYTHIILNLIFNGHKRNAHLTP